MELKDKLTFLPTQAADERFPAHEVKDEDIQDVVTEFWRMLRKRADKYIEDRREEDHPISMIDFAVDIIFEIGKRDGLKQAYRESSRIFRP